MKREELQKIVEGITDEQLKAILDINTADIGKAKKDYDDLKVENDTLKTDKATMAEKINELTTKSNTAEDYKTKLETLQGQMKQKEEDDKKAKADAELTEAITAVFGDKKFTSDYVRKGIIADMKTEIGKAENKGKGYAEIFESLTKDKDGLFVNPNTPADMKRMGDDVGTNTSENAIRAVMGLAPKKD